MSYPNPTKDNVMVKMSQNRKLTWYGATGRAINSISANKEGALIDLSSLPKGIYFIKLETKSSTLTKKIIRM